MIILLLNIEVNNMNDKKPTYVWNKLIVNNP